MTEPTPPAVARPRGTQLLEEVALSPFVAPLRAARDERLREFIGLPGSVPFSWAPKVDEDGGWSAHVRIGAGDDQLELDLFDEAERAWFRGNRFSASYRTLADGRRPTDDPQLASLLDGLMRRFRALDVSQPDRWAAFRSSVEEAARFDEVKDRMLRTVSHKEALVRLGFRCNQSCDFCWQNRRWPEPPDDVYHRWIDELGEAGCQQITFSGGEPTLHRALPALLERAKSYGMYVTLQSNCVQLAKPALADRILGAGVDVIFASYHSHIEKVSDEMTRARGTHRRTEEGIRNALDRGVRVELNAVVERRNIDHLESHAAHIAEVFAAPSRPAIACVQYSHPCQGYEDEAWEENVVPLDEVRPHLLAALAVLRRAGVRAIAVGTCGFPPCVVADAPEVLATVRADAVPEGDSSGRFFPSECDGCAFRKHCLGVRTEYHAIHGARGVVPFTRIPEVGR